MTAPKAKRTSPPKKDGKPDWQAIERDYRTAKFTLRELATKHGPSHQAIAKRAKKHQWTQDLAVAIKQATNAKLVAALVDKEVAAGGQEVANTVLAAAELNKQVILQHRGDIRAARNVAFDLLAELKQSAMLVEHQDLLVAIVAGEGAKPKDEFEARKVVMRALDLGSRVASVKALTEAFAKLQGAERKAFSLDDEEPEDPGKPDAADKGDIAMLRAKFEQAISR